MVPNKRTVYMFVDLEKAFDRVPTSLLELAINAKYDLRVLFVIHLTVPYNVQWLPTLPIRL